MEEMHKERGVVEIDGVLISVDTEDVLQSESADSDYHPTGDSNDEELEGDDDNTNDDSDDQDDDVSLGKRQKRFRFQLNEFEGLENSMVMSGSKCAKVEGNSLVCQCCDGVMSTSKFASHATGQKHVKEPLKLITDIDGKSLDDYRRLAIIDLGTKYKIKDAKRSKKSTNRPVRKSREDARNRIKNFIDQIEAIKKMNEEKGKVKISTPASNVPTINDEEDDATDASGSDQEKQEKKMYSLTNKHLPPFTIDIKTIETQRNELLFNPKSPEKYVGERIIPKTLFQERVSKFKETVSDYYCPNLVKFVRGNTCGFMKVDLATLYVAVMAAGGYYESCIKRKWKYIWTEWMVVGSDACVEDTQRPEQTLRQTYLHYLHALEVHFARGELVEFRELTPSQLELQANETAHFRRAATGKHPSHRQCRRCGIWERQPEVPRNAKYLCHTCAAVYDYWREKNPRKFEDSYIVSDKIPTFGGIPEDMQERANRDSERETNKRKTRSDNIQYYQLESIHKKPKKDSSNSSEKVPPNWLKQLIELVDIPKSIPETSNSPVPAPQILKWTPKQVDNWVSDVLDKNNLDSSTIKGTFEKHEINGAVLKCISIATMRSEMGLSTGAAVLVASARDSLFC